MNAQPAGDACESCRRELDWSAQFLFVRYVRLWVAVCSKFGTSSFVRACREMTQDSERRQRPRAWCSLGPILSNLALMVSPLRGMVPRQVDLVGKGQYSEFAITYCAPILG